MKLSTAYILLMLTGALLETGFTQSRADQNAVSDINSSELGVKNYLILKPDLDAAGIYPEGAASIPFSATNNSNQNIHLLFPGREMEGLAFLNQTGQADWIEDFKNLPDSRPIIRLPMTNGGVQPDIVLKPGETRSLAVPNYNISMILRLRDKKVFGVVEGFLVDTKKTFTSYSAPFSIPGSVLNAPWDDLGVCDYLSVTPDLTGIVFGGTRGDFRTEPAGIQRKEPDYAERIKNGWAETIFLPVSIKNASAYKLVVNANDIRYYVVGDEKTEDKAKEQQGWWMVKLTAPVVAPGESISSETSGRDDIPIKYFEDMGCKPGDQLVAVVDGRIADTNKVFECLSAPFMLPPLPKGEPPKK